MMRNIISCTFLHLVLFILPLLLSCSKISTNTFLNHQLVAVAEERSKVYKCIDKERRALLDFKSKIYEDPNGLLSTWTSGDCCKWKGVECDSQTGHVKSLSLIFGYFRGQVSPSLLNLTSLSHLDLWGNSFSGTIPPELGSVTELRYLDLSWNDFTGTIPPELGNLTNLQVLRLERLGGCTTKNLEWLSRLSRLEELSISGISLAKENHWINVILRQRKLTSLSLEGCDLSRIMHPYSYSSVNSSSSIVSLSLRDNNLNSSMYDWLFPLTSNRLVKLDLSNNKLDRIPKYFGNLCGLTILYFYNNTIPVKFPDFMNNISGCALDTLQELHAQNSQFTGTLSDDIQKFSSLKKLVLSSNQLNGTICEKVWQLPKLRFLDVSFNSLEFVIPEKNGKSKILDIDLSKNLLEFIDLSSCKLGPSFLKWIQALKSLTYLGIDDTGTSDTIPMEFWNTWPSQLKYLDLSSNNITGEVTNLLSNFDSYAPVIDLSSNNFYGHILNVSSTLQTLDLSGNKFSGGISFLCNITDRYLTSLDLSNNSFSGPIPDCLWHFKGLEVLKLGQNKFSGRLPTSIAYSTNLKALYLHNNNLSGEFPLFLQNCTKLTFLHLGENHFSGPVPGWIGEILVGLYALSLKSNNFYGNISLKLCQLVNLQILDLSVNNFVGNIPSCINNLTTMVQSGFSTNQNVQNYSWGTFTSEYLNQVLLQWQGSQREFSNTLGLLKIIDLSCNNLTGSIPYELTDLQELIALNLSMNTLFGEIPPSINQMKKLLSLDLSRNKLSGGMPSSISQMTLLNYLDVSYNALSGRIPSSTQLQSFVPSWYTGNAGLCGPPLTKYCPGDKNLELPSLVDQKEDGGKGIDELERWFAIGGGIGFAIGFSIACGTLLVSRRGSAVLFHLFDSLKDWTYVRVMVFVANLQRAHYP